MPEFTVIIPSYNHGRFLSQRIESVLDQTFTDFEVIIMDDCSTDNSREIIEKYRGNPKIASVIINTVNSGSPYKLWETAIKMAGGQLIWVAESDDFCEKTFLQTAFNAFTKFPSIGIFYSDGLIYDDDKKSNYKKFSEIKNKLYNTDKWSRSYFEKGETEINTYLKFDCTINNVSGMVFRKKIADPFYAEGTVFRYFGDWFYYINICFRSDIYYSNEPLNTYRKHKASLLSSSNEIVIQRKEYFQILNTLLNNKSTTGKKDLLIHFAFFYLHPGLLKHGILSTAKIFACYFRVNWKLAVRIIPLLFLVKIFRPHYKKVVKQIEYKD